MTAKQKAAREKFKKVVADAKKIRKANPKLTQAQAVKKAWAVVKKVGAIKIVEKGESKSARPSATYEQKRTKRGTYAGLKKVGAVKKKASKKSTSYHKDTKSHNVRISVVSGIHDDLIKELNSINKREIYFNDLLQKQLFEELALKSQSKGKNSGIAKAQLQATRRYIKDIKGILKYLKSQKLSVKKRIK